MDEKSVVTFGSQNIEFGIIRSARRTISIIVDPYLGVYLRVPRYIGLPKIQQIVKTKAKWISDKMEYINKLGEMPKKKEFVSGEAFSYLNRQYRLLVEESNINEVFFLGNYIVVETTHINHPRLIRVLIEEFYKQKARKVLVRRVEIYCKKLNLPLPPLTVANQTKKWGSCNSKGHIRINWRIVMAPIVLVDYISAHELCHVIQKNHSTEFWKLLGSIMPDYDTRRERLRREGYKYFF
ncbi:MAG: SprT family zinc-dependent metalloprotease [Elusimicrobiota bacterium]